MIGNTQSVMSSGFSQLQQQQAQRQAEQAEQRANALQAEAARARSESREAEDRARNFELNSDQARGEAESLRSGLFALDGFNRIGEQLGEIREQLGGLENSEPVSTQVMSAAATTTGNAVVNMQGQVTGTTLDVVV